MSNLQTSHLRVINGVNIFSARLADREAQQISNRLKDAGVSGKFCDRFRRQASVVLTRAIHEDPSFMAREIEAAAIEASRSVISGSRRSRIISEIGTAMRRSAGMIYDASSPKKISDPFNGLNNPQLATAPDEISIA